MRILIVNQVFYPDEVAVSQVLTDLAEDCAAEGHRVSVIAGRRDYENPGTAYPARDSYKNIVIRRISSTAFPKSSKLGRLINFITFNVSLFFVLASIKKKDFDCILGSTVPPMIAVITSIWAKIKGLPFVFWVMDLQPDEAIAAGYLKTGSIVAQVMDFIGKIPLRSAKTIIVLDGYMKEKLVNKGVAPGRINVCAVWPVQESAVNTISDGSKFRKDHGFNDKFVVMYSGNHSICHPLETLLGAADLLRDDPRFLFVFIGGGVRAKEVSERINNGAANIRQLPFQPRSMLAESLCSADVHAVIMGNEYVGIVHPCKIYGTMACGRPTVFIGPERSHVADLVRESNSGFIVTHGDGEGLADILNKMAAMPRSERAAIGARGRAFVYDNYTRSAGTGKIIKALVG